MSISTTVAPMLLYNGYLLNNDIKIVKPMCCFKKNDNFIDPGSLNFLKSFLNET